MSKLADRIKQLREKRGFTQEKLSEKVGLSRQSISYWESGRSVPGADSLAKVAAALDVRTDYLLGGDGENDDEDGVAGLSAKRQFGMDTIEVPILSREITACCGNGISFVDATNPPEGYVTISKDSLHKLDQCHLPFAIFADGDCLDSDDIHSSDLVIINPAEKDEVASGAIVLVKYEGMLSLKRFYPMLNGDVLLRSDDGERRLSRDDQELGEFDVVGVLTNIIKGRPRPRPL